MHTIIASSRHQVTDITSTQLSHVHVVARRLWPYPARSVAKRHNDKFHNGVPTAHIDPEPEHKRGVPRYCVWCPVCERMI
jgi:hypothetical protein